MRVPQRPAWQASLDALEVHLPILVAFSGGADSTALLLACVQRWPGQVRAVHVHHGLQEAADRFEAFCQDFCAQHDVPLKVSRVRARHASGESPEDAARRARHAALDAAAREFGVEGAPLPLVLAQHADDQVETLLIALSRGAGLPGLSAMPSRAWRQGVLWLRPWLDVPGPLLRAWLRSQGQDWVEDPSNQELRFTRNRLRRVVLPALEQALPAFRSTWARSAAHAAQAQTVLDEVAEADLAVVGQPPRIAHLQALSPARQALVIRRWLKTVHQTTPSQAQLEALLRQIDACRTRGHHIDLKVGRGQLRRAGEVLVWQDPDAAAWGGAANG